MHKKAVTVLLAGTLALGGCAAGPGGVNPWGDILGSILSGGAGQGYGNTNDQFQTAAINACGDQASRYGQVRITDVRQVSDSTLQVEGVIAVKDGYQQRSFTCSFRSDGRITDFRVG